MKIKYLLLMLSIISYSNEISGNIKFDYKHKEKIRELEYDKDSKIVTENLSKPILKENTSILDGNMYINKNYFFNYGFEISDKLEETKDKDKISKYQNYYFSSIYDENILKNINLKTFIGYKKGYVSTKTVFNNKKEKIESKKVLENAIIEALKIKNSFDEIEFKDNKEEYLKENGYFLDKADNNFITSITLNSKINNSKINFSNIYSSKDFKTHNFDSIFKTTNNITRNINLKTINSYSLNEDKGSLKNRLLLNYKLDRSKNLKTDIKFNIGKLASFKDVNLEINNEFEYKINKNISNILNFNYKNIINRKENIIYSPSLKYDLKYIKDDINLNSIISNEIAIKYDFITKNISKLDNIFNFNNKLSYEVKNLKNEFNLDYNIISDLKNKENIHNLLLGPSLKYDIFPLKINLDLKYLFNYNKKINHNLFLKNSNFIKIKINEENSFDLSLNIYDNLKIKDGNLKNFILLEPSIKYSLIKKDFKFNYLTELNYYNYNIDKNKFVNSLIFKNNFELRNKLNKKLEFVLNINSNYGYNYLQQEYYKVLKEYIENYSKYENKYNDSLDEYVKNLDFSRQDTYIKNLKYINNTEKDTLSLHSFRLNPKISLVYNEFDGKLQLLPFFEAILDFKSYKENYTTDGYKAKFEKLKLELKKAPQGSKERAEKFKQFQDFDKKLKENKLKNNKFNFRNFEGRIGLNIKYSW